MEEPEPDICYSSIYSCFLIGVISSLDGTQALQYTHYTSHKLPVQFQYPTTWEIIENETSETLSKLNTSYISITDDPSSEDGGYGDIGIFSQGLSVEQAKYISNRHSSNDRTWFTSAREQFIF